MGDLKNWVKNKKGTIATITVGCLGILVWGLLPPEKEQPVKEEWKPPVKKDWYRESDD